MRRSSLTACDELVAARRRDFLRLGLSALAGGMGARRAFPNESRTASLGSAGVGFGRAKSCILVYLLGGPSHLDMWDLKPEAPAEIRGPFQSIATSVPGLRICEHLPRLAQRADRYALVRSVTHPNDFHTHMIYYTLTGRHMENPNSNDNVPKAPQRRDHPHFGSVVARFKTRRSDLPGYVALPSLSIRMQPVLLPAGSAGFLGPRYDPFEMNDDPRKPNFAAMLAIPSDVSAVRSAARETLLAEIDGRAPNAGPIAEYGLLRDTAARLVGPASARVFMLDQEEPRNRDRYGDHRFGQSLLLARRLVEAGVSVVAVHFNYMSACDGWDTHSKNFECLQSELLPLLDQGLSALLDDLAARGRLDETLVVTMGEFGRTPKINPNAGRDHWGRCASVVLAGGGIRGGQTLGASDKIGAVPDRDPIDPADLQATMYHALGIDPGWLMQDQFGRSMTLSAGQTVSALF